MKTTYQKTDSVGRNTTSSTTEGPAQAVQEGTTPLVPGDSISRTILSTVSTQLAMTLKDEGFTIAAIFASVRPALTLTVHIIY